MTQITIAYALRTAVRSKVSGRLGYITGFSRHDRNEDQYYLLHIDGDGNRATQWLPEHEIEALPPGVDPPFLPPWPGPTGADGPGSVSGPETAAA